MGVVMQVVPSVLLKLHTHREGSQADAEEPIMMQVRRRVKKLARAFACLCGLSEPEVAPPPPTPPKSPFPPAIPLK